MSWKLGGVVIPQGNGFGWSHPWGGDPIFNEGCWRRIGLLIDRKEAVNIHVYKDDQQLGPYSVEQIESLLQDGTLALGDLAWVEGAESFMPVENVCELMTGSSTMNEP